MLMGRYFGFAALTSEVPVAGLDIRDAGIPTTRIRDAARSPQCRKD
jgi:hypothetical protein